MITIEITEEVNTHTDMVDLLREIARQIEDNGNTSGFYPHWSLQGKEETETDN